MMRDYLQVTLGAVKDAVKVYRAVYRWQRTVNPREFDDVFGHILGDAEVRFVGRRAMRLRTCRVGVCGWYALLARLLLCVTMLYGAHMTPL